MYDQHIIYPGSVRNTAEGWQLGARLPYYRGQILSACLLYTSDAADE